MRTFPLFSSRRLHASAALTLGLFIVLLGCDTNSDEDDDENGDVPPTATVQVSPTSASGSNVSGTVEMTLVGDSELQIEGTLSGLTEGDHGLHLHATGDCSAAELDDDGEEEPAGAAGPHYDADDGPDAAHGAPSDSADVRHFGDFGNVTANADGEASVDITVQRPEGINFESDVVGRALMVHEGRDDLETDPGGDAGTRFGCGVPAMEDTEDDS